MRKWLLAIALAGCSLASAKTYTIAVGDPTQVGGARLKPGRYHLTLNGTTAVFTDRNDRTAAQAPVKIANAEKKYPQTEVESSKAGDIYRLREIRLGGTTLELEFN